jgi:hypothetical protein
MLQDQNPSGAPIPRRTWPAFLRLLAAMPALFGSAFIYLVVVSWAFTLLPGGPVTIGMSSGQIAQALLKCPVLAAVAVAMHRALLLGETGDRLVWTVPRTYTRFVVWTLAFELAWMLPITLLTSVPTNWGMPTMIVLALAYMVVSVRLLLLFPALAVAAPGARPRAAWLDSRGRAWSFFWAEFVPVIPFVVLGMALSVLPLRVSTLPGTNTLNLVVTAIVALGEAAIAAIVASRLFQAYGSALLSPAE